MQKHHHYIIHKPYAYLSQFVNNQTKRKNKKLLGELGDFAEGTMAIGRLDETSEGLLLLTTDGAMSELVRSKKVEKEYYVQVDGEITDEAVQKIRNGVEIRLPTSLYTTLPCAIKKLVPAPSFPERSRRVRDDRHGPSTWVSITLVEGKFRQIRKMTAAVGFPTLRLIRVRIGEIELNQLGSGEIMEVESFEV
ncbi:MAG: 23S rRNA pseudouridine2457 synthase [Luteibaculaceae bacterium]|jgi:23S rRNA pseudouridine2457 synthase